MQDYTPGHITHLKSYFKKHFSGKNFTSPLELYKYVQAQSGHNNVVNDARVYLNSCEQNEILPNELILKYRKVLKIKSSQLDYHVPALELIKFLGKEAMTSIVP